MFSVEVNTIQRRRKIVRNIIEEKQEQIEKMCLELELLKEEEYKLINDLDKVYSDVLK